IEVPLAAMDVTLSAERYLNLSAAQAEERLSSLVDWAAAHGGGFAVLWHSEQYDSALLPGWDRLYRRLIEEVQTQGGVCLQAGALAEEAREWLSWPSRCRSIALARGGSVRRCSSWASSSRPPPHSSLAGCCLRTGSASSSAPRRRRAACCA